MSLLDFCTTDQEREKVARTTLVKWFLQHRFAAIGKVIPFRGVARFG